MYWIVLLISVSSSPIGRVSSLTTDIETAIVDLVDHALGAAEFQV